MSELTFYIDDHALLFALQARAIMQSANDGTGLELIEALVINYGRERGARSARRCLNDGHPLSVTGYFLYSEWHDEQGWNQNEIVSLAPYHVHTVRCGWCDTWKKYDLLEYGQLYCRWIDPALVYGFSPEMRLEMASILSSGAAVCSFTWPDCVFTEQAEVEALTARRRELIPVVTRDFLYHCAHLHDVVKRILITRLGMDAAYRIIRTIMRDFADISGVDKAWAVQHASRRDLS